MKNEWHRGLHRTIKSVTVKVELVTIRDKKRPMFRARYPTEHMVQAQAGWGILFQRSYTDKAKAREVYDQIIESLNSGREK